MAPRQLNFFGRVVLHKWSAQVYSVVDKQNSFCLRSLLGLLAPAEISGRVSSSSLPPLFVPGRFAGFCIVGQAAVA